MQSNRLNKTPIASTYGDVAAMPCSVTFAATAVGTHDMFELPPGAELFEVGYANAALGTSTTLALGYRYKDSTDGSAVADAFKAAASCAAAGSSALPLLDPLSFTVPVIITATIAGASATGKLTVTPKYRYLGTK